MKWYFLNEENEVAGPVSEDELEGMLRSGSLSPETQVCREGTEEWYTCGEATGLRIATEVGENSDLRDSEGKGMTSAPPPLPGNEHGERDQGPSISIQNSPGSASKVKSKYPVKLLLIGCGGAAFLAFIIMVGIFSVIFGGASGGGNSHKHGAVETVQRGGELGRSFLAEFGVELDQEVAVVYGMGYSMGANFTRTPSPGEIEQMVEAAFRKNPDLRQGLDRLMAAGVNDGLAGRPNRLEGVNFDALASGPEGWELSDHCGRGNLRKVKEMATASNVNRADEGGIPLHEACRGGHLSVAKHLLSLGADVNIPDVFGLYPIHLAASSSNPELFELLIRSGAQPNQVTTQPDNSALPLGVIARNRGRQPIHYAVESKNFAIAKTLIELGVSPKTEDLEGSSAIDLIRPLSAEWMNLLDPSRQLANAYENRIKEASGVIRFDGIYRLANSERSNSLRFHADGKVTRTTPSSRPAWVSEKLGNTTEETTGTYSIENGKIILSFITRFVNLNGLSQEEMLHGELPGRDVESKYEGKAEGNSISFSQGGSLGEQVYEFISDTGE